MADHEQQQFHYSYKIVLLGEIGVGKTAIFNRIKTGRFIDRAAPEIAGKRADQYTYNTYIDENSLTVSHFIYDRFAAVHVFTYWTEPI